MPRRLEITETHDPDKDLIGKARLDLIWLGRANIVDIISFVRQVSLKMIDATVKDMAANDEERRRFGKMFLELDDDFDAACIIANQKPNYTRAKVIARAEILRERNERRKNGGK